MKVKPSFLSFVAVNFVVFAFYVSLHNVGVDGLDGLTSADADQEEVKVNIFEDKTFLEDNSTYGLLRFNISWEVFSRDVDPSSYSIVITTVMNKNDSKDCPDEFLYYTTKDGTQKGVILPENQFSSSLPELSIRPDCTYKIEIFANPLTDPLLKRSTSIIYTVPECILQYCSCVNAKTTLPIPKINVKVQNNENIVIKWNSTTNQSQVASYVISVGLPLVVSKNGFMLYNITKIGNVTSPSTKFHWNPSSRDGPFVEGTKIMVIAEDYHGCSGRAGTFILDSMSTLHLNSSQENYTSWWIFCIVSAICLCSFAIYVVAWSYDKRKNDKVVSELKPEVSLELPDQKEPMIKRQSVLYVNQEIEDAQKKGIADEYEMSYERIELIDEIGEGHFGKVYLGKLDGDRQKIAIKMFRSKHSESELESRRQLLDEIAIMKAAGPHPNLIGLVGCCTSPQYPNCIVLEYLEGGDLLAFLRRKRKTIVDEDLYDTKHFEIGQPLFNSNPIYYFAGNIIGDNDEVDDSLFKGSERHLFEQFAMDIARGMEHLEAKRITHRDLAARNILLTADMSLKISDFGLSRNSLYVTNYNKGVVRSLPVRWMSPEALRELRFSSKSDVWSYAILLWEIATLGAFPYSNVQDNQLYHFVSNSGRLQRPSSVSTVLYHLMMACWSPKPESRPTFAQIVSFLQGFRDFKNTPNGEPSLNFYTQFINSDK